MGLHVVEAISGLKINMENSELIPIREIENVEGLASVLGYKVGKLPATYNQGLSLCLIILCFFLLFLKGELEVRADLKDFPWSGVKLGKRPI